MPPAKQSMLGKALQRIGYRSSSLLASGAALYLASAGELRLEERLMQDS